MKKLALSTRTQEGFTLIELMVVVTLVAILAALAMPSFTTQIANQRVTSAAQDLQTLLQFARAESVYKRTQSTVTATGQTWQAKDGAKVLREATVSDVVSIEPGSSGGLIFDVTGQAKPASGGGTSYTASVSAPNASRVQCLTVTGTGLVRLKSAATKQACS
jgi:type II secretion system protein H